MSIESKPTVFVIAGPNGAGKTTFAQNYLLRHAQCQEFVNADLIAAGLSPFDPDSQAVAAGRLMLRRIDDLISQRKTFGFETTLSGRMHARRLHAMSTKFEYTTTLFFIWLPTAEMAIQRVATRVRQGGHSIPAPTIERRYRQGITNFRLIYAPLIDQWIIYDGSDWPAAKIVGQEDGTLTIFDDDRFEKLSKQTPELIP